LAQVKARGEKRLGNPTNLAEAQRKGAERRADGRVRLLTRKGSNFSSRFPRSLPP
jgi:hypothetical protein